MSSLTIEELKKLLLENGVDLPAGRLRKEDYVKLYEDNVVINRSSGVNYSDDESTQNSRKVTSTNEFDSQAVEEAVTSLSNDDLFVKLKQLGYNPGPILPNTRSVYEKKFLALLKGEGPPNGNGVENNYHVELSDNEAEGASSVANNRQSQERHIAPPPVRREASRERSVSYQPAVVPEPPSPPVQLPAPRRFTYIERIPRGSSERVIVEERSSVDREAFGIRQRTETEPYKGRWSPTAAIKAAKLETNALTISKNNHQILILAGVVLLMLAAVGVFVYLQWSDTDPYKLIEDDAEMQRKEV